MDHLENQLLSEKNSFLQKELAAKNRELEIEAALERVRQVAMSMMKTDDLLNISKALFSELKLLGFDELRNAIINTFFDHKSTFLDYDYSDFSGGNITGLPYDSHPLLKKCLDQIQSSTDAFAEMIVEQNELEGWKENRKKYGKSYDPRLENISALYYYFYSIGGGAIGISTFTSITNEKRDILKKFRNVFDLGYRRYIDIANAEAQAREAKIQLALERVRARTMAMQHSDELKDVANLLFQQVHELGIPAWSCGFNIWEKDEKACTGWMSTEGFLQPPFKIPLTESPTFIHFYESRQRGESFYSEQVSGQALTDHYNYMLALPDFADIAATHFKAGFLLPTSQIHHVANFSHGNLIFITSTRVPEAKEIFIRFAKVFEQTYTRFLDLQKAEAQAREAQIELGLERVRARAMAMRNSEELKELIGTVFIELTKLDLVLTRCLIMIYDPKTNDSTWWMANSETPSDPIGLKVQYHGHAPYLAYIKAWHEKQLKWTYPLEGEIKKQWDDFLFVETELSHLPDFVIAGMKAPGKVYLNASFNTFGNLTLATLEPLSDEHFGIMLRFAKVFDLTYTRFNDLQKAEAQAREAQIEVALEKVRSRSLAMRKSDELNEVVLVVFEKLKELNVVTDGVALINLYTEGTKDIVQWMANPELMTTGKYNLPYFDHPIFNNSLEAKKSGKDFNVHTYSLEEKNSFFEYCFEHTDYKYFPDILKKKLLESEAYTHAVAFGKYSAIVVSTFHKKEFSPEAIETMKRFSRVFEQSYIRFLDLQKAEAQAKEAVKQAALDRIRAEIASMRTVDDLDRITPLIWKELTILGIPFIRCGVFIMDEEQEMIHTFLSTPDGKAIAAFQLAYTTPGNISEIIKHWRKKEIYCDHWDEETFREFANGLEKQGEFTSLKSYVSTLPAGGFYLHFIPFLQGMLYVGNTTPLGETDRQLIQSIADAFSTAYARYEDFNKLEEAKKQVDKTLLELQATQKQLIQSEKMASLGELTAGIAHEIQNPLNFVNNFSDVNQELLVEMKDEMKKGNIEEADLIVNDVIENEQKINHHGKRADAIVKGMLQHSRNSSGQKEPTDINALADEYLRLSYHGLRAKDKAFNAEFITDFDESVGKIDIVPQDIGRVLLNLFNNAFYAVNERQKGESAKLNASYKPLVSVETKRLNDKIEIKISDNGNGIPQKILDKIYQPFFTTKPTGEGTGLGLSLSYDIIKAAGGEIKVETKEGEGTEFIINLS